MQGFFVSVGGTRQISNYFIVDLFKIETYKIYYKL